MANVTLTALLVEMFWFLLGQMAGLTYFFLVQPHLVVQVEEQGLCVAYSEDHLYLASLAQPDGQSVWLNGTKWPRN